MKIEINALHLQSCIMQLSMLELEDVFSKGDLKAARCNLSTGLTYEELNNVYYDLNKMNEHFNNLIHISEQFLVNVLKSYEETDQKAADEFSVDDLKI